MAAESPSDLRAPRTAVVADPDGGRLEFYARTLRDAGYSVLCAGNADELTAALDSAQPSVMVVDASLSAVETAAPVLVVVDLDNPAELAAMTPAGIHDCIAKPPPPRELVHRATALIEPMPRQWSPPSMIGSRPAASSACTASCALRFHSATSARWR